MDNFCRWGTNSRHAQNFLLCKLSHTLFSNFPKWIRSSLSPGHILFDLLSHFHFLSQNFLHYVAILLFFLETFCVPLELWLIPGKLSSSFCEHRWFFSQARFDKFDFGDFAKYLRRVSGSKILYSDTKASETQESSCKRIAKKIPFALRILESPKV